MSRCIHGYVFILLSIFPHSLNAFTQNNYAVQWKSQPIKHANDFYHLPRRELKCFIFKDRVREKIGSIDVGKEVQNLNNEEEEELFYGIPETTAKPLGLLLFAQFMLFIGIGAVIPTLPLYGKEIGLSSATNGIIVSAPALALLLFAKPSGEYADKARKPAMMWGMALIAVSDFGTAIAQSLGPLLIARLGLGAGRCVSESGERGLLGDLAGTIPSLRGRALALQQAVMASGIAIGAPVGGLVVETYGPRAAFLCVTGAALSSLVLYYFLPETVENTENDVLNSEINESTSNIEWKDLIQDSRWRGISIYEAGARVGYAVKIASIPVIAASVLPGGAFGAGALLSAAGISGLAGSPVGGWLSDRIGARNTVILSGIFSGVALLSIPFTINIESPFNLPDGAAFGASVLLWSTAVAAQNPAANALAQEIAPPGSLATAMSLPRACGDSVYLFAPFLLGLISDRAGIPLGTDCAIAGACGLLGLVALITSDFEEELLPKQMTT